MASLNKVVLMGNITRDLEVRYTNSGTAVLELGLAINRKFENKEEVTFVDITVWDKQAENTAKYCGKGSQILIEGRLQTDTWDDRETGKKRSKMRVVAENVQWLNTNKPVEQPQQPQPQAYQAPQPQAPQPQTYQAPQPQAPQPQEYQAPQPQAKNWPPEGGNRGDQQPLISTIPVYNNGGHHA